MTSHESGGQFGIPQGESAEVKLAETVELQVVGRLSLGEGKIETHIESEQEAKEFFESALEHLKPVEDRKCAVCIDGRCGVCTASQVSNILEDGTFEYEKVKPPLRPHVPGGLYFYSTLSAILADLEVVREAKSFDEAHSIIGGILQDAGYEDGGHTTVLSLTSEDKTECGAQDGIAGSTSRAVELDQESEATRSPNGLDEAISALHGIEANEVRGASLYSEVRKVLKDKSDSGIFAEFDSVANLRSMVGKNSDCVELLESDKDHPTALHEEEAVLILDIPGYTVDRDSFHEATGKSLFIFDRWMLNTDIAPLIARSEGEHDRLRVAGDYSTAFIANKLVKSGMWAGYVTDPRLALAA